MRRVILYWAPALIYMFTVFLLSTEPSPPELPSWSQSDKIYHFAGYLLMGLLWTRLLNKEEILGGASGWAYRVVICAGIIFSFGVFIEYCQASVPGRSAEALDAVANGFGGLTGSFLYERVRHRNTKDIFEGRS